MSRLPVRFFAAALTLVLVLAAERLQSPMPMPVPFTAADSQPHQQSLPEVVDVRQQPATLPPTEPGRESEATSPMRAPQPSLHREPVARRPRVAIIIDDMGYNLEIGRQLLQLDMALSFSFLPAAPHTPELVRLAQVGGRSILVHLPMEPREWRGNEEQPTLQVGESEEAVQRKIDAMLAAVPAAGGANNHMGSRFTEDRRGMRLVLARLRAHAMFFVDSFTTAASVGEATAHQMGLPTGRRTVFLDNEQHSGAICRQLGLLATKATTEGQAIAIGHPNRAMIEALSTCADERLGYVHLVGAEHLVR